MDFWILRFDTTHPHEKSNNLCKSDQLGMIDLVIIGGTVDTITDYNVTWTDVNNNGNPGKWPKM